MGIFSKRSVDAPSSLWNIQPASPAVNYDSVTDYLIGLSKAEFDKIFKVATIYRQANQDAAKVLGVKPEPTTQLAEPEQEDVLDDHLDSLMLLDEEPLALTPAKKQKTNKKASGKK